MDTPGKVSTLDPDDVSVVNHALDELLRDHPPQSMTAAEFLRAQYRAGLANVAFPHGLGGLELQPALQRLVTQCLYDAGAPSGYVRNPIGWGHIAPAIVAHGTREQAQRWLPENFSGEEVWCQLFSEPVAGSDLAGLATRAVQRDGVGSAWTVRGHKVWTSAAHFSRWGALLARTDPDVPKHRGLTFFIVDMHAPGVRVTPLRQLSGDAEFNEVFLEDVVIPDDCRIGEVGAGWQVALTTLMNERVAMGGAAPPRGAGIIREVLRLWRDSPKDPAMRADLVRLWVRAETLRLTNLRSQRTSDGAGPEGAFAKLASTELNMALYDFVWELLGPRALEFSHYDAPRISSMVDEGGGLNSAGTMGDTYERPTGPPRPLTAEELLSGYLRSRANGVEAGTSEIQRNVIAERVLGLPRQPAADAGVPWREIPRG